MKAWFAAIALLVAVPAAAQPQDITAAGAVRHATARAVFPEMVGEMRRIDVTRFSANDISASYELRLGDDYMRASVYIYPAPPAPAARRVAFCREHMAGVVDIVMRQYAGASEVENGAAAPVPGVDEGPGYRAVHEIEFPLRTRAPEPTRSESRLYCYVAGDWLVKYRVSANPDFDVDALIEELVRSGPWPGRGPGSIAMH